MGKSPFPVAHTHTDPHPRLSHLGSNTPHPCGRLPHPPVFWHCWPIPSLPVPSGCPPHLPWDPTLGTELRSSLTLLGFQTLALGFLPTPSLAQTSPHQSSSFWPCMEPQCPPPYIDILFIILGLWYPVLDPSFHPTPMDALLPRYGLWPSPQEYLSHHTWVLTLWQSSHNFLWKPFLLPLWFWYPMPGSANHCHPPLHGHSSHSTWTMSSCCTFSGEVIFAQCCLNHSGTEGKSHKMNFLKCLLDHATPLIQIPQWLPNTCGITAYYLFPADEAFMVSPCLLALSQTYSP